jgi:hypothetical protein
MFCAKQSLLIRDHSEMNNFSAKKQNKIDIAQKVFYILQNVKYNQACHRYPIALVGMRLAG